MRVTPSTGFVSVESDTIPGNQTAADSCGHSLTVFFHHETGSDKSGNADAVRYTATSGARVFASGSHTFAWALDDFAGNPDETHSLADPRLQRFALNALDDLTRPAPPTLLDVRVTAAGVLISVQRNADARVTRLVVRRRRIGSGKGKRNVLACSRRGSPVHAFCQDHPARGTYRYVVVVSDRWATSLPLVSTVVRVR